MTQQSFHEFEFKLDGTDDEELRRAQHWVETTPGIFARQKSKAPAVMQGLFQRSLEVTEERVRIYYDTIDLKAMRAGVEIRQEAKSKGGVKQMVKTNGNGHDDDIMDRMEYPSHVDNFGVSFDEIQDKAVRRRLRQEFDGDVFKPVVAMISQRTRLKYHPDGNPDILIEAAFDYPCWGFAVNGFIWKAPEMELEIVRGPGDHASARKLLEREGARFEERFDLKRMATSKPTPGLEDLSPWLATQEGKHAFRTMKPGQEWWMTNVRADFAARVKPVAKAG